MSKGAQTQLIRSKSLAFPNAYVTAMYKSYKAYVWDEEDCVAFKGCWREKGFGASSSSDRKMDLEIGPGSGGFFAHICTKRPERLFVALELKYKPLIQTARKIKALGCTNAKVIRYNACMLTDVFAPREIDNIYIHFPDPWPKKRHHKHRLIKPDLVRALYALQKKGSFVEVKTDHQAYFKEIQKVFSASAYRKLTQSQDLHKNPGLTQDNFITSFEKIFINKKQAVYYLKCVK